MARGDRPSPKRGAYPTPRDVLADAVPYKPDNSAKDNKPDDPDLAGDQPDSKTDSAAESREQPKRGSGENGSVG